MRVCLLSRLTLRPARLVVEGPRGCHRGLDHAGPSLASHQLQNVLSEILQAQF